MSTPHSTGYVNLDDDDKMAKKPDKNGVNRVFLRRLVAVARIAVPRWKSPSFLGLALLLLVSIAEQFVIHEVGLIPARFYTVLNNKDRAALPKTISVALALVLVMACTVALKTFISGYLNVLLRSNLVTTLHKRYFASGAFYSINNAPPKAPSPLSVVSELETLNTPATPPQTQQQQHHGNSEPSLYVDNPDQRITQDADRFAIVSSTIADKLLVIPITIIYYTYAVWHQMGWFGVVSIYVFFAINSILNQFLMSALSRLVYALEAREGDFRFAHVRVRREAEPIAFYSHQQQQQHSQSDLTHAEAPLLTESLLTPSLSDHSESRQMAIGECCESSRVHSRFESVIAIQRRIVMRQFPLSLSVQLFDYLGSILSYLILAVPVFSGAFDHYTPAELSSHISACAFIAIYLISQFSAATNLATLFSRLAGYTHRLGELCESLTLHHQHTSTHSTTTAHHNTTPHDDDPPSSNRLLLRVRHITVKTAHQHTIIENGSFTVHRSRNVLVNGLSGAGKTSLFRALAGLWPVGRLGSVSPFGSLLFLPQVPYVTEGSLIDQIVFPLQSHQVPFRSESFYEAILRDAQLSHLMSRIGTLSGVPSLTFPTQEDDGEDESTHDRGRSSRSGHRGLESRRGDSDCFWSVALSPGEKQRLAFARLFYHKPDLAVIDEGTSALDETTERALYEHCRVLGVTLMSAAHRSSLKQFHSQLLEISNGELIMSDL